MTPLTDHVLLNAALATMMAPFAFASRYLGRPILTHVLWLLVLARLIVPPVWCLPIPTWNPTPTLDEPMPVAHTEELTPDTVETAIVPIVESLPAQLMPAQIEPALSWSVPWSEITLAIWAVVALGWWCRLFFHALRFQYLLRYAEPADGETIELVSKLARRLGLRRPPKVVTLPVRLSPCVWCFTTRPVLLLPRDWTARQHRLKRAAILVHELAHLRRGDHWVRWFELGVTGLFWWLPTVWFARRYLREAEEQCCDNWVIATLPAARQAYATALVDMADYLAPLRPALPPLASGFGHVHELRRRLHMILHARPVTKTGRSGAAIALGLGLFLLPVGWVRSQPPERDAPRPSAERPEHQDPPREERDRDRDRERAAEERARERARSNEERERANATTARRDAMQAELRAQLAEAQRRLADAQRAVERIQQRMNEMNAENRGEGRGRGGEIRSTEPVRGEGGRGSGGSGGGRGGMPARPSNPENQPEPRGGRGRSDNPPEPPRPPRPPQPPEAPRAGPDAPRGGGTGGGRFTPSPGPNAGGNDRIQLLERQLEMLRKELDAMRREMRRDGSGERRDNDRRPENRPPQV